MSASTESIDAAKRILAKWRSLHDKRPDAVAYSQDRHSQIDLALEQILGFALETAKRVEALETGGIKYCGNYQRALAYQRGSVVTDKGDMWTALTDVPEGERPGTSTHWQLSQKGER